MQKATKRRLPGDTAKEGTTSKVEQNPKKLVWHLVGGVPECAQVPSKMANMIIFVLAQPAEYYLEQLKTKRFQEILGPYVESVRDRI